MSVMYIRNYTIDKFDREMFLMEYIGFMALLGMMRKQARQICFIIKPLNITCQVHTGYLFRGSPRMPRSSPM